MSRTEQGLVHIYHACITDFGGGPFSVGSSSKGDHFKESDGVTDKSYYHTMDWAAGIVSKHAAVKLQNFGFVLMIFLYQDNRDLFLRKFCE